MRKKIAAVIGGMVLGSSALLVGGTAHAGYPEPNTVPQYMGDYGTEHECMGAGAMLNSANAGAYSDVYCVANGGGPRDASSWSLYAVPWIHPG